METAPLDDLIQAPLKVDAVLHLVTPDPRLM